MSQHYYIFLSDKNNLDKTSLVYKWDGHNLYVSNPNPGEEWLRKAMIGMRFAIFLILGGAVGKGWERSEHKNIERLKESIRPSQLLFLLKTTSILVYIN